LTIIISSQNPNFTIIIAKLHHYHFQSQTCRRRRRARGSEPARVGERRSLAVGASGGVAQRQGPAAG